MPDWYTVLHHRHNNNTRTCEVIVVEHFETLARARLRASFISAPRPNRPSWYHDSASIEPGRLNLTEANRPGTTTEAWVNGRLLFTTIKEPACV